jgi:hypothetical protein
MITLRNLAAYAASFVILFCVEVAPESPIGLRLVPDAQAIVGAPLTPVSVAGVARRTTRRVVVAESSEASAQASAQAATAQQQAATAQQQSATAAQQSATAQQQSATAQQEAAASGALALGTVVSTLPAGCSKMSSGGVEYYKCGPDYYRTAFQGNNLVYVTAKP